jgi:Uma2 family endonuclease
MQLERARRLTSKDVEAIPYDWRIRVELIGGALHVSTAASFRHQQVVARIAIKVGVAVEEAGGCGAVEAGVVWEDDGTDNVKPDLVFLIRTPPPAGDEKLRTTPDIIVEVVSRGKANQLRDFSAKRRLYLRRGALEYWIVDPSRHAVARLVRDGPEWREQILSADDVLRTPLLPKWPGVTVRELFP